MNIQVKEQTSDWKKCCEIIEWLGERGDEEILCDCIRMCCANSKEVMNCLIGQYEEDFLINNEYSDF